MIKYTFKNETADECLKVALKDPYAINSIKSERVYNEVCEYLVKMNPINLKYVDYQSPCVKEIAVKTNPFAIVYATPLTRELCLKAVKANGMTLEYINTPPFMYDEGIALAAVIQNPMAIKFVHKQTPLVCLEAVRGNGALIEWCEYTDDYIFSEAIKHSPDDVYEFLIKVYGEANIPINLYGDYIAAKQIRTTAGWKVSEYFKKLFHNFF